MSSEEKNAAVIGCLLDVSGSMRAALETDHPDEQAIDRLNAVFRAALQLAQSERERNRNAQVFVGVFGLNEDARCPPVVDLCGITNALLDVQGNGRTGHDLLVELGNQSNGANISDYVQAKLSDDEACIIYLYLQRYPEHIPEFVSIILEAEVVRSTPHHAGSDNLKELTDGQVLSLWMSAFGLTEDSNPVPGYTVIPERQAASALTRIIWETWWKDFIKFVPRPGDDVVRLLQQLQDHPLMNGRRIGREQCDHRLVDILRRYMFGATPVREALQRSLSTYLTHRDAEQRVLVLISDGASTDGDPLHIARELRHANVNMATVYLTSDRATPRRQLYDQAGKGWSRGQRTLFDMATRIGCDTHPIPVLASMGWEFPSSGECAVYTAACSAEMLEEFCTRILSERFGTTHGSSKS